MKIAISIPDPVFEAAEHLAKRLGKSRSQLYSEAVIEFLGIHRADAITEQLNTIYSAEESALDATLERAQYRLLEDENW